MKHIKNICQPWFKIRNLTQFSKEFQELEVILGVCSSKIPYGWPFPFGNSHKIFSWICAFLENKVKQEAPWERKRKCIDCLWINSFIPLTQHSARNESILQHLLNYLLLATIMQFQRKFYWKIIRNKQLPITIISTIP